MKSRKRQSGIAMIEAAVSLPIILLALIAGIDLLFGGYQRLALQYALTRGARLITVGESLSQVKSNTVQRSRVFGVQISANDIRVCPESLPNCSEGEESVGGGSAYVWITARTTVGVTDYMRHQIRVSLLVRTEPV